MLECPPQPAMARTAIVAIAICFIHPGYAGDVKEF
jgi:hypothetical protein